MPTCCHSHTVHTGTNLLPASEQLHPDDVTHGNEHFYRCAGAVALYSVTVIHVYALGKGYECGWGPLGFGVGGIAVPCFGLWFGGTLVG